MNTFIAIRDSTIYIGNTSKVKKILVITGPEMFFYKDYNLFIYPKSIIILKATIEDFNSKELDDKLSENKSKNNNNNDNNTKEEDFQ